MLLLGVFAILTKSMLFFILAKVDFCEDYKLMQLSLDQPKIQHIY